MRRSATRFGGGAARDESHRSLPPGTVLAAGLLALTTVVAFAPVRHHEFVTFDDPLYITRNPHVATGLSAGNAAWAFSSFHAANWHPLTWLSHMLDVTLFGLDPGPHHLVGLALHTANAVLLFFLFVRMTGATRESAFLAFLFALHPQHVESVAWASERKDVLSTFFWIATTWAYVRYAERPGAPRYLAVAALLAAGLLAKPMLVTLPLVLLLLDLWPLSRQALGWRRLVVEKLPLLTLSAASCAVTIAAQRSYGSVAPIDKLLPSVRAGNALVACAVYLAKTLWPTGLAVFYPYDESLPVWELVASAAALIGATALVLAYARRVPALAVGWLWYLVTLLPVIGLVQVGNQARADRYTYVPLIGIFVIAAWGVPALLGHRPAGRKLTAIAAVAIVLLCAGMTRRQLAFWKDNDALCERAIAVTGNNAFAHYNLAYGLSQRGDFVRAAGHYAEAARIKPGWFDALYNLGNTLRKTGRLDEAAAAYGRALGVNPSDPDGHRGLGLTLEAQGHPDLAASQFREALRLNPDDAAAREGLARVGAERDR